MGQTRILLINQFFWPDSAATSQILTDVARECASLGCEVTALCGAADYAHPATDSKPDVRIIRSRNFRFRRSQTARLASYLSFLLGALWHGLRVKRPQVVLTLTTPPLLCVVGALLKKFRGSKHFIWEMDVYPDVAIALGALKPNGVVARGTRALADWSRRNADGIIVLGEDMKALLVSHGISADNLNVCENWADGREITPLSFPDGPLTIHYSGNLGLGHEIRTIRAAMLHFRENAKIRFVFAGKGPGRPALEEFCGHYKIDNVIFRPYSDRCELGASLAEGHLGLVTQLPETLGCIVPSKTYGIMASGRPLLYIGPKEATPARHIVSYHCGWQLNPGDVADLIALLEQLIVDPARIYEAGRNARAAFEQNFDRPIGIRRVCQLLDLAAPCLTARGVIHA